MRIALLCIVALLVVACTNTQSNVTFTAAPISDKCPLVLPDAFSVIIAAPLPGSVFDESVGRNVPAFTQGGAEVTEVYAPQIEGARFVPSSLSQGRQGPCVKDGNALRCNDLLYVVDGAAEGRYFVTLALVPLIGSTNVTRDAATRYVSSMSVRVAEKSCKKE